MRHVAAVKSCVEKWNRCSVLPHPTVGSLSLSIFDKSTCSRFGKPTRVGDAKFGGKYCNRKLYVSPYQQLMTEAPRGLPKRDYCFS
jgi:hypothetical protein